jgi:hypothetical protein
MILVADFEGGKQVEVLTVKGGNASLGSLVLPDGFSLLESKQKYTVPDFQKLDLQVHGGMHFIYYYYLFIYFYDMTNVEQDVPF